jgi:tetratricopeptide (TPR) repeat protein
MFLFLRSDGLESYIKGEPALEKGLGSGLGRKFFIYFLGLILGGFLSAQSAAGAESAVTPLTIGDHVSYFSGLLVVFGFVIGVWLTVIMMIVIIWRLRLSRQNPAKNSAATQSGANMQCSEQDGREGQLIEKIGLLKEVLKGMADQVEKLEPNHPFEKYFKSAQVQEDLEDLILEADSLVNNMEEEMVESAQKECRLEVLSPDSADGYCAESPEHAEMHIRARNLRAEGCRLLAEDKSKEAMCRFEESLSILQTLAKANPENQLWQRDLVLAYHNMGRTMESLGLNQEALDYFSEALDIARKLVNQNPGSLDWKRGLAASHSHTGRIMAAMGDLDGAWKNFDKEIDVMLFMVNKQPENKSWQYALASAYHNMGQLLERRGQNRAALDIFKKDQAVLKRLVEADPNNTCWLYDLACVSGQMARMYKEQGRLKDALGCARRYLGAMRKLSEREPANTTYRRELTVALGQVGRLLELRGEYDQARTTFKATLEIRRNLVEMDPGNPTWQDDLLVCLYKMGDVHFAQKDHEGAWRYYQEALEMVEALIDKDGREDNWLMGKCGVLLRLGNLHQVHDSSTADNYYRSALNIAEQPHGDDDKESDWRELAGLIKKNMSQGENVTTH